MKQTSDSRWQRQGMSWIWDEEARNRICTAAEVLSLREFVQAVGKWSDDLPSNGGSALVVAGLDGSLDLLTPAHAEEWLSDVVKPAVLSFQAFYEGQAALSFWVPYGRDRFKVNPATDAVHWVCGAPHSGIDLEFGRLLWGQANDYPQEILLRAGAKPAGLFHLRIT